MPIRRGNRSAYWGKRIEGVFFKREKCTGKKGGMGGGYAVTSRWGYAVQVVKVISYINGKSKEETLGWGRKAGATRERVALES